MGTASSDAQCRVGAPLTRGTSGTFLTAKHVSPCFRFRGPKNQSSVSAIQTIPATQSSNRQGCEGIPLPLPWTPAGLTGSGRVESVRHAPRQQPGLLSDLFDLVACLCFALRVLRSLQHSQRGSEGSCPRGHSRPHARPPLARGDPW